MTTSATSIALIRRPFGPADCWLAVWNAEQWGYEFPESEVRPPESPQSALTRDLQSRLGAAAQACAVPPDHFACLTISPGAAAFGRPPGPAFIFSITFDSTRWNAERINPDARWISEAEVHCGQTREKLPIATRTSLVLRELQVQQILPAIERGADLPSRWKRWRELKLHAGEKSDLFEFLNRYGNAPLTEVVEVIRQDFTERSQDPERPSMQEYFTRIPQLNSDPQLKVELIVFGYHLLAQQNAAPALDSYAMQFPDVQSELIRQLRQDQAETAVARQTVLMPLETDPKADRLASTNERLAVGPDRAVSCPQEVGRYQIRNVLGSGRFGIVYEGWDEALQRRVAIKVAHRAESAEIRAAYLEEARNLATLNHPQIVPIFDFGVLPGERCYFVQKFISGESLADRLRRGRVDCDDAVRFVAEIADALHASHCQRIVHRDVKPANMLIHDDGTPYIVDFGLAANERSLSAQSQQIAGTPAYMSPEQIRGETGTLDGRSDLWSLGVVLYELLAGERPFAGDSLAELANEICYRDPKPIRVIAPSVSIALERICLKCLNKPRTERYLTGSDLAAELRRACPAARGGSFAASSDTFEVISADYESSAADFPVMACSLMNRMDRSLAVLGYRVEVSHFQPYRGGGATSHAIAVLSQTDVVLPPCPGAVVQGSLRPPILIAGQDAVTLQIRLMGGSTEVPVPPTQLGGFRYRIVFIADSGWEASTHELSLDRFTTSG